MELGADESHREVVESKSAVSQPLFLHLNGGVLAPAEANGRERAVLTDAGLRAPRPRHYGFIAISFNGLGIAQTTQTTGATTTTTTGWRVTETSLATGAR